MEKLRELRINGLKIPLSLPLVLLATLTLVFAATTPVHAQFTGLVCIADNSSTNCPSAPPNFTGPTGSQLTIAVNIQGSDTFNGYDIRVKTDPTVLNPVSVDTETNSLLAQSSLFGLYWFGCVNGTPTNASIPNGCNSSLDTIGVVHIVAVALGGQTPSPSTGHLFSITYNIVSGTGTTSISFPVAPAGNTTCSPSSVTGTNTCVQVVIQNTVDPETVQAAGFNQAPPPPPNFTISASPTSLTLRGETSGTSTITITSLNGFNSQVTLSASVSPVVKDGLTASLNPTSVMVPANGQASSSLTATARGATPKGSYTITVTATGGGITKQTTVTVTVTAG